MSAAAVWTVNGARYRVARRDGLWAAYRLACLCAACADRRQPEHLVVAAMELATLRHLLTQLPTSPGGEP